MKKWHQNIFFFFNQFLYIKIFESFAFTKELHPLHGKIGYNVGNNNALNVFSSNKVLK